MTKAATNTNQCFRIGVWCDYGATLTPHEGIGVFVYNLIEGMLESNDPLEIVMLVHDGEQHVVDHLCANARGRVRVLPERQWTPKPRLRAAHLLRAWLRASHWLAAKWTAARSRAEQRAASVRWIAKHWLRTQVRGAWHGDLLSLALALVCAPVLFLAAWTAFSSKQLLSAAAAIVGYPLRLANRLLAKTADNPRLTRDPSIMEIAKQAQCDVWIIPYVGFEYPLEFPCVVFVHDMVVAHFPEMLDAALVKRVMTVAKQRVAEATLCACMSAFIRDNDLLGVLRLPPSKVRMIRPAAASDFPSLADEEVAGLVPDQLRRPFLFYPAAFRGYKNHRLLIEALALLHSESDSAAVDLAFTGPNTKGVMPADLEEIATRLNVRSRIHVLGKVDRRVLAALYKSALATLVPSLYEQGSFPIYEALFWKCPVAASSIPSLQEQCAPLGDAMLYFDPHSVGDVVRTIRELLRNRDTVLTNQQTAAAGIWSRNWKDAARESGLLYSAKRRLSAAPLP